MHFRAVEHGVQERFDSACEGRKVSPGQLEALEKSGRRPNEPEVDVLGRACTRHCLNAAAVEYWFTQPSNGPESASRRRCR